jgi:hypothetical protein
LRIAVIHHYQESPVNQRTTLMNTKILTSVMAIVMVWAFSQGKANAQAGESAGRSVEGVWMVTITPLNCVTGMPVPGAAFEGLFTFHKGGTMSAWLQNSLIMVTRSPSQGLWQRDHGWSDYAFKFVHLRYDGSGFYSGRQESEGTLVLNASGNEFTSEGSTAFFDVDGNSLGGGCSNSTGTRFDLDL